MSLRDTLRKAASLVVEMPPEERSVNLRSGDIDLDDLPDLDLPANARLPGAGSASDAVSEPRTIEQLVRDSDGPNLDQIQISAVPADATAGAALDFAAIYGAAKLPETQFGAEAMLEMLRSLPSELPLETRRATVKAMLGTLGKNMGATPDSIVADASRKLAALQAFGGFMERKTGETIAQSETQIADLEAQIDAQRQTIQNARAELNRVTRGCESEADKLDDVLEFFSLDQGASRHAASGDSEPLSGDS